MLHRISRLLKSSCMFSSNKSYFKLHMFGTDKSKLMGACEKSNDRFLMPMMSKIFVSKKSKMQNMSSDFENTLKNVHEF